jgi:hypothetical protein
MKLRQLREAVCGEGEPIIYLLTIVVITSIMFFPSLEVDHDQHSKEP